MVRRIFLILFFLGLASLLVALTQDIPGKNKVDQSTAIAPDYASQESATPTAPVAKKAAGIGAKPTGPAANAQFPLDSFKNFSAIMIGSMLGGDEESNIYRRGNLMRTGRGNSGNSSYMITDLEKGDTYGVAKTGCLHDPNPGFRVFPFRAAKHGTVSRVTSGKETLNGHSCVIENVSIANPGPGGGGLKFRFWEAEDLQGFPIKIEFLRPHGRIVTIEYKDVILSPPDVVLFKHPLNCQSLTGGVRSPKVSVPAKAPVATPRTTTPPAATPQSATPPATKPPAGDSHN
ncbi:MAG: hypothetical protein WCD02_04750 [Terriglobales bacterium]